MPNKMSQNILHKIYQIQTPKRIKNKYVYTKRYTKNLPEIKGPENPTSQLLPILSKKYFCGDGEGRRDKGRRLGKVVCDKVVSVKDVVWQSLCGERWCVTKLCVKEGVSKMVCDKVVCERRHAKNVCNGVWTMVCVCVCQRCCVEDGGWQRCLWKLVCENSVWQCCVAMLCDNVVCEKWCVKNDMWNVVRQGWCVKDGVDGVWQSAEKVSPRAPAKGIP